MKNTNIRIYGSPRLPQQDQVRCVKNEKKTRGSLVEETRAASRLEDETRGGQLHKDKSKISLWLGEMPLASPGLEGETKGTQTSSDKSQMPGKLEVEGFTKNSPGNNWFKVKNQTANWIDIQKKGKPQAAGWVVRQIIERSILEDLEAGNTQRLKTRG